MRFQLWSKTDKWNLLKSLSCSISVFTQCSSYSIKGLSFFPQGGNLLSWSLCSQWWQDMSKQAHHFLLVFLLHLVRQSRLRLLQIVVCPPWKFLQKEGDTPSPHKITFTPHNAVDWLARCWPDRTDREGFWRRLRNAIKTFSGILHETNVEHGIVYKWKMEATLSRGWTWPR